MKKHILSIALFVFSSLFLFGYTYMYPTKNGNSPGCAGGGCHSFKKGLVSVKLLDSVRVQVTVSGVTSGKPVAGELVNSAGKVVDYINSTKSNPFILTATEEGTYRINAGFKNPSKQWDSASVVIQHTVIAEPDSGWQSDLIITEIMFDVPRDAAGDANGDGVRGSHSDEFVEFYNRGSEPIDMSGYQILDREKIPVFTFPDSSILATNQFAVVFGAVGSAGFGANIPSETLLFAANKSDNNDGFNNGIGKSNFSNSGDCVVLVNPAKNDTLAEVYWGGAQPVTSKPVYLGFPNTVSGSKISGAIRQSVTRRVDSLRWDIHTIVSGEASSLYSPGWDVIKTTGIISENLTPKGFQLFQNYPNPFNPTTKITFGIPTTAHTTLKVFTVLGKEVITIVNKELDAGTYQYSFDGSNLSSGIYICELQSDIYKDTKKMLLVK